jgi:hypothetical protein
MLLVIKFNLMQYILRSILILVFSQSDLIYIVDTDGSNDVIGGVLYHDDTLFHVSTNNWIPLS